MKLGENLTNFYKGRNVDKIGSDGYKFAGWVSNNEFKIHGVAMNVRQTSGEFTKEIPYEFTVKIRRIVN